MGFDLLQDFWPSLSTLEIAGVEPDGLNVELTDSNVREPLTAALDEIAGPVDTYDFKWLRSRVAEVIRDDEFCITLDHGIYFPRANFQLDLSRTAPDLRHTGDENLARLPRDTEDLPTQLAKLRSNLSTSHRKRVVLADDGISTGTTLGMVISRCHDYDIDVKRVVVCCNNLQLKSIESVRVLPIVNQTPGRPWLNERDLYWGLPRSGVTLAAHGYSIPFSADSRFVRQRIGVKSRFEEFRLACLRANIRLWDLLESQAGRPLYCEDCPALRMIPSLLEQRHERHGNTRVIDLLTRLIGGTDGLDFDAPVGASGS